MKSTHPAREATASPVRPRCLTGALRVLTLAALAPIAVILLPAATTAQGNFVNFETPEMKSIEVARLIDHDYLLVCNTPDNSVLIYDTHNNKLMQRVPVGLGPVTVVYNPYLGHFYTCNQLGDSVSMVRFAPPVSATAVPKAELVRTVWVGDEPTDLAFTADQLTCFVTMRTRSAVTWLYSLDLTPVYGDWGRRIDLTYPVLNPYALRAIKEPRRMLITGNEVFVLNYKGGRGPKYDYDLMAVRIGTTNEVALGGLGTTNASMVRAPNGDLLVVGTLARNELKGEAKVAAAQTGFVESHLWLVKDVFGANPTIQDRNLNIDPSTDQPVAARQALSQPTDVAIITSDKEIKKVYVTAFHSDKVAVLYPSTDHVHKWKMTQIAIPTTTGYALAGPRSLVFKDAAAMKGDPGMRIYVRNQLGNSFSVIDPSTDKLIAHIPLPSDPTPSYIRYGREFLYSANHSGNGFVACASCHVDGRTDSLVWDLGDKSNSEGAELPQYLIDGVTGQEVIKTFPADKGPMMTQTLQGLVNHHIESASQYLMTNAPYHWRADRATFLEFNPAFVSLMGKTPVDSSTPKKGLTAAQMLLFERMVNSVTLPPNPDQSPDRIYSGSFGKADLEDGAGALRGLKLFHTRAFAGGVIGGRSCVGCHQLGEGSNNRITLVDDLGGTGLQPIESAQTRSLVMREGMLEKNNFTLSQIRVTENGLLHDGHELLPNTNAPETVSLSINWFMFLVFGPAFSGSSPELSKLVDVIALMREFDTGTAPIVGAVHTVTAENATATDTTQFFNLVEGQAKKANGGVAVYVRNLKGEYGFYYDVTIGNGVYRQPGGSVSFSRANLLALLVSKNDVLVAQATPVGSEIRVATLGTPTTVVVGAAPTKIELQPMVPNAAWAAVPELTKNWPAGTGANDFKWDGIYPNSKPVPTPNSLKTTRLYQQALIQKAPKWGLEKQRHEAPRRFRVAGYNIRDGAVLRIWIPRRADPKKPLSEASVRHELTVKIFPTKDYLSDGRRVWSSTAEVDGMITYMLMLGGPDAPGVVEAFDGKIAEPLSTTNPFDPQKYNSYIIQVINSDGSNASATGQVITIE